jgi:hypothetical protein
MIVTIKELAESLFNDSAKAASDLRLITYVDGIAVKIIKTKNSFSFKCQEFGDIQKLVPPDTILDDDFASNFIIKILG